MKYTIPLFDLNFDGDEEEAVVSTLRSKWISMGPRCASLEQTFSARLGAKYALSVANCTVALHMALRAVGVSQGDEVILPSLTFVATANAVRYCSAIPVFCDIKGVEDLTIDANLIESLVTPRTKAIIVMHYAGFPCDMDSICKLAKRYRLKIVEDACHGPLSEYKGAKLGTLGDIGCFSFFSNKNISTGEGGMIVTNDLEYYEKMKLLRSHGMTSLSYERSEGHSTSYDVVELGYNYRMDDIHASIAIAQLKKLRKDLLARKQIREKYLQLFKDSDCIGVPFADCNDFVSNYIFPVILRCNSVEIRDNVRAELHRKGVQTSVHYPSVHRFSIYKEFAKPLKNTEYVSDNEITLPMYARLRDDQLVLVAESLKTAVQDALSRAPSERKYRFPKH